MDNNYFDGYYNNYMDSNYMGNNYMNNNYMSNLYPNNYYNQYNRMYENILKDYGPNPFVINIEETTKENNTFRTALWTEEHLQLTLMSIPVGGSIGLENHPDTDQFLRIEQGDGLMQMGQSKENLNFQRRVYNNYAIIIPAGTWHNLINIGNIPIKLYSIYAPPKHPKGTVHLTKAEADEEENH